MTQNDLLVYIIYFVTSQFNFVGITKTVLLYFSLIVFNEDGIQ